MEAEKDLGGFFAVSPKTDCPHIQNLSQDLSDHSITDPCQDCTDRKENWICLICGKVACSRFVNGHMSLHFEATGHNLTLSFSDLSFWCYLCDSYVVSNDFRRILKTFQDEKFPTMNNND